MLTMAFTAKVKRVGGSTYLLVPPAVVRELALKPDQEVEADIQPRYPTLNDAIDAAWGLDPDAQYFDRDEAWGDYGKRFLE